MYSHCSGLSDFLSVKVVSAPDNETASIVSGLSNSILQNPLVDDTNGQEAHVNKDHVSINILNNRGIPRNVIHYDDDQDNLITGYHLKNTSTYRGAQR